MSSIFSRNSEAYASEFIENIEGNISSKLIVDSELWIHDNMNAVITITHLQIGKHVRKICISRHINYEAIYIV